MSLETPLTVKVAESAGGEAAETVIFAAPIRVVLTDVVQQPGFGPDTPVVVVAEGRVPWDHVVNAWNAALRAGFVRIAFGDS